MNDKDRELLGYLISIGLIAKVPTFANTHPGTDFLIQDAQDNEIWDADLDVSDASEYLRKFTLG